MYVHVPAAWISLGIFTLISDVNIYFASAHQLIGILLFLSFIRVVYRHNT